MKLVLQIAAGIIVAGIVGTVLSVACVALFVGGAAKVVNDAFTSIDKTSCAERPTRIASRHDSQTAESYTLATQRADEQARDAPLPSSAHTVLAKSQATTIAAQDLVSASIEALSAHGDATALARC